MLTLNCSQRRIHTTAAGAAAGRLKRKVTLRCERDVRWVKEEGNILNAFCSTGSLTTTQNVSLTYISLLRDSFSCPRFEGTCLSRVYIKETRRRETHKYYRQRRFSRNTGWASSKAERKMACSIFSLNSVIDNFVRRRPTTKRRAKTTKSRSK